MDDQVEIKLPPAYTDLFNQGKQKLNQPLYNKLKI